MNSRKEENRFNRSKEGAESAHAFCRDYKFPPEAWIHLTHHKGCAKHGKLGKWKSCWHGEYQGTDWHMRRSISFECDVCHASCMFTLVLPFADEDKQPMERILVFA